MTTLERVMDQVMSWQHVGSISISISNLCTHMEKVVSNGNDACR